MNQPNQQGSQRPLSNESSPQADSVKPEKERPTRLMYIEIKAGQLTGDARIGYVTFSKTGKTIYYNERAFQTLKGAGFKSNYVDVETGEEVWISGPKKDGSDRLYGGRKPIGIDQDAREDYWVNIRNRPDRTDQATT